MTALPTAASELVLAQLDAVRTLKGVHACERTVRTMRKSLERFPGKLSAMTPDKLERATARKEALDMLGERCHACVRCSVSEE